MMIAMDSYRIDSDATYLVCQIGVSRVGTRRAVARGVGGRFLAIRKLVVAPQVIVSLPNPRAVRRNAPLARAIAILTMVALCGRWVASWVALALRAVRAVAVNVVRTIVAPFALNERCFWGAMVSTRCQGRS